MPAFIDNLLDGPWLIRCANGQYFGTDPNQTDPAGNRYLITVPTRATAAFFNFAQVQAVSPTNVTVTISVASLGNLAVDSAGYLVLASSGTPTNFTAIAIRSSQFQLGQSVTSSGGQFMTYDPQANRFSLVANASGTFSRFGLSMDLPDGALLWQSSTSHTVIGTPYVYSGSVFASDTSTLVSCHDVMTGMVVWETGEAVAASCPVEVNYAHHLVFTGDNNGVLHAVGIDDGTERWTFQATAPIFAAPSAYVDRLFIPSSDGIIYAVASATGQQSWRSPATGNMSGLYDSPAMAGTHVYFGGWDNNLHAVDTTTGQPVWTYEASDKVNGGISVDAAAVYVGTDANEVVAVKQADGTQLWSYPMRGIVTDAPLLDSGFAYFGSVAGDFVCVAVATGAPVWQQSFSAPIASRPAIADGVVYFNTYAGMLYAVDAATGATIATYNLGAQASGSPIALSGVVYAAAGGQIFCLSQRLVAGFNPTNAFALLLLSSWSNTTAGISPTFGSLPAGWQSLATFVSSGTNFASGGVTALVMPGTDENVVALTFGVNVDSFLPNVDRTAAGLVALPASIGGTGTPSGATVNSGILASYLAVRSSILTAISSSGCTSVRVAGLGGGGALATLAALDLSITAGKTGMPTVTSLAATTFGAPAVGNQAFASYFNQQVASCQRVQNVTDTMPLLLPASVGYVPVGQACTIGASGVTTSASLDPTSFLGYRIALIGR
jgi:outer membrane protein assembly factor BamB